MTSRRSSGSRRAASMVEPTRSQNITVSCRRSAAAGAEASGDAGDSVPSPAMSDQTDAEILQILGRQARQDPCVDLVRTEGRLVLVEPEAAQPSPNIHP